MFEKGAMFIMMDTTCINALIKHIIRTDVSELGLKSALSRPMEIFKDADGRITLQETLYLRDRFGCSQKVLLSDVWIASNILLFTVFDGFLENKYSLIEGDSFRKHYDNIPETNDIERMTKNCYRIFKIIRNGIQHNLSNVQYSDVYGFDINYVNKNGTTFNLQISKESIHFFYTFVTNLVTKKIYGLDKSYSSIRGFYEGFMYFIYTKFEEGISPGFMDDLTAKQPTLLPVGSSLILKSLFRCLVGNPIIAREDDKSITFYHINNNNANDENDSGYQCYTDYCYGDYILPQEIGKTVYFKSSLNDERDRRQEELAKTTITFQKKDITVLWKVCV